jgi:hypothetical protein
MEIRVIMRKVEEPGVFQNQMSASGREEGFLKDRKIGQILFGSWRIM